MGKKIRNNDICFIIFWINEVVIVLLLLLKLFFGELRRYWVLKGLFIVFGILLFIVSIF